MTLEDERLPGAPGADEPQEPELEAEADAGVPLRWDEPPYERRPRASRGDPVALLSNGELARIFSEIADMLEVKGELRFKVDAYRKGAESIAHSDVDVARAYREARPPRLPGVGKAIDEKLAELADTGRLRFHERLREEVPPSLVALLEIPGLGPRTIYELHRSLGIVDVDGLRAAAETGRLRSVRGMSRKTEERVLEGIRELPSRRRRMRLGEAEATLARAVRWMRRASGVTAVHEAGSFRRRQETIGDLDLLAETSDPEATAEHFLAFPASERVVVRGAHKAAIRVLGGPQLDLMLMPPGREGTYLVHFTGSAAHNVRLRERARDLGWSLSEHGFARLGEDGEIVEGDGAELRTFGSEEEVYAFLGLPYIPPELREDRGEIEAALAGTLPSLVTQADLQGDCHSHSEWSDGALPIERVAETARRRGYAYQVLTDHSLSLTIANGLDRDRVEQQRLIIRELNDRFAREEDEGRAPEGAHPSGFRLLHGCELEIRTDGRLDYDADLLSRFDVVVASLHVGRRQPRAQLMERYLTAIRSPHVDIISHPSGRKIHIRDDLDLDWELFYAECARTGTLVEMNGSDERLDLDDRRARVARDAGCLLTIDSDMHYLGEFENVRWGVAMARRAWIEAKDVANTWSRERLLDWVARKGERL